MDKKETFQKYMKKISSFWKTGKIQRIARITYDVTWNVILFFLLIGFIGLFFAGGIGAGYFASLVKDEPIRSYDSMEKDIYNYEETSKLYFAGNNYIGNIKSDLHREEVDLEDVSDLIVHATTATEDQNFENHKGIVPKAIVRAVIQEALNSEEKSGGSTLTQQLIKNQILTNEVSFERKAKEILLAMRLEHFFSKDQILEAYLNIIPYGREASGQNIAGIQTAAQGVFGVDAKDVNIPQAAFLAGLPQSPSAYTPFANHGGLKKNESIQPGINRMKTVLKRMYDQKYITEKEYKEALQYDIVSDFTKESTTPDEEYPRLVVELQEHARDIIMNKLLEEDGKKQSELNDKEFEEYREKADKDLRRKGYRIHSTINKKIFDAQREVAENYEHYGSETTYKVTDEDTGETIKKEQPVQTAAVLRENSTGKIISFVGGRKYSNESQLNYATNAPRSPGSTIKPLIDYGPAMDMGYIQPGSPVADVDIGNYGYRPKNYGQGHHGIVPAREALKHSYNLPAAKIYQDILPENPAKNYLEKMGIPLTDIEHEIPSLSIGSANFTVEQNVNAFTTFANQGQFIDGFMIESIESDDGEVIYEHENDPVEVFSPQTSYLTLDLMRDVIGSGTAAYLNSQINDTSVDWAGKTGTSQYYHDAWFVGTNPNVTFGTWIGYENPKDLQATCQGCSLSYSQRNNKLWAELVNVAAEIDPDLMSPSDKFERPDGIVEKSYCAISGMKPSKLCEKAGLVKSDLFNQKYVPEKKDDSLIKGSFVMVDGKAVAAGKNTPEEFVDGDGVMFNPEFLRRNGYDKLDDLTRLFPNTEREKWEKIGLPKGDIGDASTLKDDGKEPSAPTSVKHSNGRLTWNKSSSNDVVGYRILRADKIGGNFKVIGNSTETGYDSSKDGVYKVKAVDYFGLESSPSQDVNVGDVKKKDKEKDKKKDKDKDKKKDDKDKGNEKNEDNDKKDNENNNGDSGGDNNGNNNAGPGGNGNGNNNENHEDKDNNGSNKNDNNESNKN